MHFFPRFEETRLVGYAESELQARLRKHVKPVSGVSFSEDSIDYLFNGKWSAEAFSISLKLKVTNNFIPIINGSMLSSEEGTLIRLNFEMFPATKRLLLLWTILTLLITIFFIGLYKAWLYGAISFGFCIVNYILSVENFKIQVRKSKRILDKMLS
ncbi:MAG: hypothetical protein MI975_23950 [Cytophagales bacterium]|nr:hypothetical protein [Cytophagales bacterium]